MAKTNEDLVLEYLLSIRPEGATNSQIREVTKIEPHQQVFQITQRLMHRGLISGEQGRYREKEWVFSAQTIVPITGEIKLTTPPITSPSARSQRVVIYGDRALSPAEFEHLAEQVMSRHFGQPLQHGTPPGIPKEFDLVSADGSIVGDAKHYKLVRGKNLPPAKFSTIAEHVWLLEKTKASHRFLVFGNQREVPIKWLQRYGHLLENIEFYFVTNDGCLERLK